MQALTFLLAALLFISQVAAGQSYGYRADLGAVPADSFYRVLLPPAITGRLQADFGDLRLYDAKSQEVPYLLVPPAAGDTIRVRYLPVPDLSFQQTEVQKAGKTRLHFSAPFPAQIDKLVFTITAPARYHRAATLYRSRETRRRWRQRYQPVAYFTLTSNKAPTLLLEAFRSKDFYLEIENGDNPPLAVQKVQAYQRPVYLVAPLAAGTRYHLAFGSPEAVPPPTYDLPYFKNEIPDHIPTLIPRAITSTSDRENKEGKGLNTFFTSRYLIWMALVVVITLLAYMTYKLLQETGKIR